MAVPRLQDAAPRPAATLSRCRAAGALSLTYWEFDAAVQLGHVATVPGAAPWQRRVPRAELDRLRCARGFPAALRDRVRLVNAAAGAELLRISPARFARLARGGCFAPVSFYPDHHGLVVWRYPAAELRSAARLRPDLLTGPLPGGLRRALRSGADWRPRRWRSRRTSLLTRHARGPWERAAVPAAVLDQAAVRAAGPDTRELELLRRLRPPLAADAPLWPPSGARHPSVRAALTATDPEEAQWYARALQRALHDARRAGPGSRRRSSPGSDVRDPDRRPALGG